jgi:hypothetical protein
LTDDGLLEVLLPSNSHLPGRGPDGSLLVSVNLGAESVACVGFLKCAARSRVVRSFLLDGPQP